MTKIELHNTKADITSVQLQIDALAIVDSKQAAQILGVEEHTLAVWRCNKRYGLPYVKVGRKVKYRLTDLQKFLDNRTVH